MIILQSWRNWVTPRSQDRDEAFREQTIRAIVAVLLIVLALSFITSIPVYEFDGQLVSYPSLTVVSILLCSASAFAVSHQQVKLAGQFLVAVLLVASAGVTIIDGFWAVLVPPLYMLSILITALVLPRSALLSIGFLSVALFAAIAYGQDSTGRHAPLIPGGTRPGPTEYLINIFFLVMVEVMFLRQLRLEFDNRLGAMQLSIELAEKAKGEADRANKAKSQFLASMSHEFRTPLNAIIGYMDIMLAGMMGTFTDKQTDLMGHVKHNAKRLLAMINDTLDMARIEAGRVEIKPVEVSPQALVKQVVGGMESLAHTKNLGMPIVFQPNTPEKVVCDPAKTEQILINLLGNALKFTTQGEVRVEVGAEIGSQWYFKVIDTGIGMPPDAPQYIFDTFRQVQDSTTKTREGTGLGLAITKRLIEYMGGSISVETEQGKGSAFTVVLPCEVKAIN